MTIKSKMLLVIGSVILSGLLTALAISVYTFRQDKVEEIFDINQNRITTLSSSFDSGLKTVETTFRLYLQVYASEGAPKAKEIFSTLISQDPLIVNLSVFSDNGSYSQIQSISQSGFLKAHGLQFDYFDKQPKLQAIPFSKIKTENRLLWNPNFEGNNALLAVGFYVLNRGTSQPGLILVGYIKTEFLEKTLGSVRFGRTYVLDKAGNLLTRFDRSSSQGIISNPLTNQFKNSSAPSFVMKFKMGSGYIFGAYKTLDFAPAAVFSEIDSVKAFDAVTKLVSRSLVVGAFILLVTFLISFLFSHSLTSPLMELTSTMRKVSGGDLTQRFNTRSKDEIGLLGGVFNKMTEDLHSSRQNLEKLNATLEEKVKERTQQLEELATKDPLTGLFNRRYFNTKITEELNRSRRSKSPVSIIYLDIDHFKKYNDGNGHPQGDELLKQFSRTLLAAIRKTDTCARLGGEEFRPCFGPLL